MVERVFYSVPKKVGYFTLKVPHRTKEEIEAAKAALADRKKEGNNDVEMAAAPANDDKSGPQAPDVQTDEVEVKNA